MKLLCFTKNKFSSAQRGLSEPLCVKFTIQAEKSRIITHLTVRLKENIVHHQTAVLLIILLPIQTAIQLKKHL